MGNVIFYCCCWEDEDNSLPSSSSTSRNHQHQRRGARNANESMAGVPLLQSSEEQENNSPENSTSNVFIRDTGRKGAEDIVLINSLHASLVPRSLEEERSYMVRSMSSSLMELEKEPECMFCLEAFTEQDPSVKSLCGCGVNKSPMHWRCLEIWRTKSTDCMACGQPLFYEVSEEQQQPSSSSSFVEQTVMPPQASSNTAVVAPEVSQSQAQD